MATTGSRRCSREGRADLQLNSAVVAAVLQCYGRRRNRWKEGEWSTASWVRLRCSTQAGRSFRSAARCSRAVLASLLLRAGQTVALDRLVDELWDEPPKTAAKTVQVYVSRLRHELPTGVIESRPGGYALLLDGGPARPGECSSVQPRRDMRHSPPATASAPPSCCGKLSHSGAAQHLQDSPRMHCAVQAERLEEARLQRPRGPVRGRSRTRIPRPRGRPELTELRR